MVGVNIPLQLVMNVSVCYRQPCLNNKDSLYPDRVLYGTVTSGNMHAQIDKSAYVRNHGHNNMGCGHAPHGGACPHKGIPLHFQTYLFFKVGTVVSLLAL